MKFLQTELQVKYMNNKYFDLYYTVIKNRDDNEVVDDKYENYENEFITPNHYVGIKPRETKLRSRKLRSHMNHFNKLVLYKKRRKNE